MVQYDSTSYGNIQGVYTRCITVSAFWHPCNFHQSCAHIEDVWSDTTALVAKHQDRRNFWGQ